MTVEAQSDVAARPNAAEPTTDLIREALGEARELVRLEVALARKDLTSQLGATKSAAMAFGAAAVAALTALTLLLVAVALATRIPWIAALVFAGLLLTAALVLGLVGLRALPKKPLEKTKGRIGTSIDSVKERLT